eukprot:12794304-Alexandrium_andersonii.AAC.1
MLDSQSAKLDQRLSYTDKRITSVANACSSLQWCAARPPQGGYRPPGPTPHPHNKRSERELPKAQN